MRVEREVRGFNRFLPMAEEDPPLKPLLLPQTLKFSEVIHMGRKEVINEILGYIELTLKENNLTWEDIFKEFAVCPLCHSKIITCPFCGKKTIIDYKCSQCGKVLPLDRIIEELAKTVTP